MLLSPIRIVGGLIFLLITFSGFVSARSEGITPYHTLRIIQSPHIPRNLPDRFCSTVELVVDGVMAEQALASRNGVIATITRGEYEGLARRGRNNQIVIDLQFPTRHKITVLLTNSHSGLSAKSIEENYDLIIRKQIPDFDVVTFFSLDARDCTPGVSAIRKLNDGRIKDYSLLSKSLFKEKDNLPVPITVLIDRNEVIRFETTDRRRHIEKRNGQWIEYANQIPKARYDEISRTVVSFLLKDVKDAEIPFLGTVTRVPRLVNLPHGFGMPKYISAQNDKKYFRQFRPSEKLYYQVSRRLDLEVPCRPLGLVLPLTDIDRTYIRDGYGRFRSPRRVSGYHRGVDIIPRATFNDPTAYAVRTVGGGIVAYSRLNGTMETGYGNIIVVDHENDCYSLYAHLANTPFSPIEPGGNLLKRVGDEVKVGEILGYFVDIESDVDSTGNARRTSSIARHQVHFEIIKAPSGRQGTGSLGGSILAPGSVRVNPEPLLLDLGYGIE